MFKIPDSDKYGREYKQDGKRRHDEFENQPAMEDIFVMVHYKPELVANAGICVKITWLVSTNDVAVVEYNIKYVEGEAHGNN